MPDSSLENYHQQLAQLYADMSDTELEKIANDAGSLTSVAQGVLQTELLRRGSTIELRGPAPPADHSETGKLVTLRKFRDVPEALLAKSILDSASVECFLGDENLVRVDWFWSNLLGGIKLWVREEDASAAAELLDQDVPEEFNVNGVGDYVQPRCLSCQSFDISFEELNRRVAFTTAWLGLPVPLKRSGWRCHSCGHQWVEPGPAST